MTTVYGANASEALQKIAADQQDYHKCSSCVIVCWIAPKIYRSITGEKRLVTSTPSKKVVKKLQKLHWRGSNNWPMRSFIQNGSKTITWTGYSLKTKRHRIQGKTTFFRKKHLFWTSSYSRWFSTRVLELYANSLFLWLHVWKIILGSSFYQRVFSQFVGRKVVGLI